MQTTSMHCMLLITLCALLCTQTSFAQYTVSLDKYKWAWITGSMYDANSKGIYPSEKGVLTANVHPSSRNSHAIGLVEDLNALWLFGGLSYLGSGEYKHMDDVWAYNFTNRKWVWLAGSSWDDANVAVNYPAVGGTSASATPGGRTGIGSSTADGFIIFGGRVDGNDGIRLFNDVWSFSLVTNSWTWLFGVTSLEASGSIGNNGVFRGAFGSYAVGNMYPGSRSGACLVSDRQSELYYVFGGLGFANSNQSQPLGSLNDVWQFNTTDSTWRWLSGNSLLSDPDGNYLAAGIESPDVSPRRRRHCACSLDSVNGYLYVYGGHSMERDEVLADTMRFSLSSNNWALLKGSRRSADPGSLKKDGVFHQTNYPSNRYATSYDSDLQGNLYIYGGISRVNNDPRSNIFPQGLWVFNVTEGAWARLFINKDRSFAEYYNLSAACPGALPGERVLGDLSVSKSGAVYLHAGFDPEVYWDYTDVWRFSVVQESSTCTAQTYYSGPKDDRIPAYVARERRSGGALIAVLSIVGVIVVSVVGALAYQKYKKAKAQKPVEPPVTRKDTNAAQTTENVEEPSRSNITKKGNKLEFATINPYEE